jgi:endonuclease/exonuclease/phosphatase family metal-dependent hydrolase
MVKRSIFLLRWANVFLVLFTLLAYISPYISPTIFWPLSFLGLVFPFLVLFNVIFVLFWGLLRKRYFIYSLLTIVVGWGHVLSFIGFGNNQPQAVKEGSFKFTSFNAHSIVPKKEALNQEWKKVYGEFADFITREDAQVFCFQEVPNLPRAIRKSNEQAEKPIDPAYRILQDRGGLGIMTKLPVLQTHSKYYDYRTNGYQWADIQLNDRQVVRVFNLHLQSNGITHMTNDVASNGNIQEKKTWKRIKSIMGQYKRAAQKRARQVEEVLEAIQQSPYPVIVCGDFNDVPASYAYRVFSENLQDAFKEKGGGWATTYTGPIPGLRIDYIFVSHRFDIRSFYTGKRNFSDHKPVSTVIRLRP